MSETNLKLPCNVKDPAVLPNQLVIRGGAVVVGATGEAPKFPAAFDNGVPSEGMAVSIVPRTDLVLLMHRNRERKQRITDLERQNAAMRAFLEVEYEDRLAICRVVGAQTSARLEELKAVLQPDAGRDFIPREQLSPMAAALQHAMDWCCDEDADDLDAERIRQGFLQAVRLGLVKDPNEH